MADEKKGGAAQQDASPPVEGILVVEITPPRNSQYQFGPTAQNLRGKWSPHGMNHGDASEKGVLKFPVIPGMFVEVDPKTRSCRTYDPLSLSKNVELMAQISEISFSVMGQRRVPVPEMKRVECTADELASWTYAVMRAVQNGCATIVEGRVPDSEAHLKRIYPTATITKKFFESAEKAQSANTIEALNALLGPMASKG